MIAWKFDQSSVRRALAYMLIVDELSFKFVEGKGFKHFLTVSQHCFILLRESQWLETVKLYLEEKKKVGSLLKGNVGRICLTTDTWTSLQRINYMCLTAHYVHNEWILRKKVLNFCHISSHQVVDIGKAIEMCLLKWGIESNVFTITVDNATAKDVAVAYLKNNHIRKSIDCVKAAVKYVSQSPQRLNKFKEYAEIKKCLSTKGLILDVPTCWNSTYLMLETAQKYERAFSRYDNKDQHYRDDLEKTGMPISTDWANLRRLAKFLEHFYELTLMMMKCKSDKYYGGLEKCNMETIVASVLDPINKLELCRNHASPELDTWFTSADASSSTKKHSATAIIEPSIILKQNVQMEMKRRKSESRMQDSKSELDRYLNKEAEDESKKFEILNWWKVNSPRFPILSLLARDVMEITISTMASESVFRTSGRVLDAFRSSLTPPVVESLICTQDWFRENSMLMDVVEN
nr:hypothetical protein [Tanacetum cinerariifolium]